MKATRPLEATGFERRSISFPSFSKASIRSNRALQAAVERGKLDQIQHFVGKGDIGCLDNLGRPLIVIADTSDYLLPKQKDDVVALLRDLPGRLSILGGADDQFVGLKSNEDRWKHKHAARNQHVLTIFRQHCSGIDPSVRDWALECTLKNPLLFTLDGDKLSKSLPVWVKQAGVPSTMLTLQTNPALGHTDPARILDVLPTLTQLLGHKDVALFFLGRQPTLLKLNQQFIRNGYRQLMAIFDNKNTVLSVLKQTTVPPKVSMVSTLQAYGSAVLGSYKMELHEGGILYKKEDSDIYLLLAEDRWEVTTKKEPETLVPWKRCRPECYLDVSHADARVIIEPSQAFAQKVHWRTWTGATWREDKKLSVVAPIDKSAKPTCLLHTSSDILRATYCHIMEMLGTVWVHRAFDYHVCADQRKGDSVFHDTDAFRFRQLGEFLPLRKFTFISQSHSGWKKGGDASGSSALPTDGENHDDMVLLLLWEPATVYRLFWVTEGSAAEQAMEEFNKGTWVRVENMATPKIHSHKHHWPSGRWVVFTKSYPPGEAHIPRSTGDVPVPFIFVKEGAFAENGAGEEYEVMSTIKPGEVTFKLDGAEGGAEGVEGGAAKEEQDGITSNYLEFVNFQAFDSFNGYVYIKTADKDRHTSATDAWFTLTVPQPITVFFVYFDPVPRDTRAWHFTEHWRQVNLKTPVIRNASGVAFNAVEVRTRTFEKGKITFRGNCGARCAVWYKNIPLKDQDSNAAQRLLMSRPLLFPEDTNVAHLYHRVRAMLGDNHARSVVLDTDAWAPVVLSGHIERFVRQLHRTLLAKLLTPEAMNGALQRLPAIYEATGPSLRDVVKALLAPCGSVQQMLKVIAVVPEVLLMSGEAVTNLWDQVQSLWGPKMARELILAHPRLLRCHTQLRAILDSLSEAFSESYARTRLYQSVHDSGPWQNWINIVCAELPATSVELQMWIGQLQSLETRRTILARKGQPPLPQAQA